MLAAAGLKRLGLGERIRARFEPQRRCLPAAGQGALGIEVRDDAGALRELLAQTIHRPTWLAAHAERAVSRALGGSCSMPLAAHASWDGATLQLDVALGDGADPTRAAAARAPSPRRWPTRPPPAPSAPRPRTGCVPPAPRAICRPRMTGHRLSPSGRGGP